MGIEYSTEHKVPDHIKFLHLHNKKDTSISYHVYLKCNN